LQHAGIAGDKDEAAKAIIGKLLSGLLANAGETPLLMQISVVLGACFVAAFYELEELRVRWRHRDLRDRPCGTRPWSVANPRTRI